MSQAAAAAGAPAPSGISVPATSHGDGAPSFDPKVALDEIRRSRGQTTQLQTSFDNHRKEVAGDRELLQRLKSAFSPEAKSAPDPVAHLTGQMDTFLNQMMELKARGQELPMTQQIALDFYQSQLENLKTIDALKKQLGELKGGVDRANDPDAPANNMAYTQIDTFLQQSLDSLYGLDPKQTATKNRVHGTVLEALSSELKELQKSAPGQWDMLRRNPMKLQMLVNNALRSIVPPKAMQMIEQEELQNTPYDKGELWAAFNEARVLFKNAKTDEQKLHALGLQRQIRQDIQDLDKPKSKRRGPPRR